MRSRKSKPGNGMGTESIWHLVPMKDPRWLANHEQNRVTRDEKGKGRPDHKGILRICVPSLLWEFRGFQKDYSGCKVEFGRLSRRPQQHYQEHCNGDMEFRGQKWGKEEVYSFMVEQIFFASHTAWYLQEFKDESIEWFKDTHWHTSITSSWAVQSSSGQGRNRKML